MLDQEIGHYGGAPSVWRHVGELLAREHECLDARFDRLEADVTELKTDVAELKTDVAELKTDVAAINKKLDRAEESDVTFQQYVGRQFERLGAYIARDEVKGEDSKK
jgi:septal ring factor EnvC (AmiA/AmiB activator)